MLYKRIKRASKGALLFLFLSWDLTPGVAQGEPCPIQREDERAVVSYVYDGDTVRLDNGERIRVVGIDAPELGRDGQPPEPYAVESRDALRALLARSKNHVILQYGNERRDRHGRLLAYLFLPDGTNVQRVLLEQGLVMQVHVAPNTEFADCLAPIEQTARLARVGIWSQPEYEPGLDSRAIPADTRGAVIVRGRVERVGRSRHAVWVNLEGRVALRINREDAARFGDLDALEGRLVRARGWLVADNSRYQDWRMNLSSPHSLEVLD